MVMALLPGVTGPGGGKFEAGLTELFRMGYYDERQNYEALEKSKGHVKAAAAFIRQGVVPDIEQGYESPTEAAPDRRLPTTRKEFQVAKVDLEYDEDESEVGNVRRLNTRVTMTETGVEVWPTDGGACIVQETWGAIRSFTLCKQERTMTLTTSTGCIHCHTKEASKLMDSIIAITTALAKEMKAKKAKKKRQQEAQLTPLSRSSRALGMPNPPAQPAAVACR
jgi:hypothetical protein